MKSSTPQKALVFILIFLVVFSLNYYTILTSDDISYLYVYQGPVPTENTHRVDSLSDLVESIHKHYEMVNGRSLAHFLLQGSLSLGQGFFKIVNSLAYLVLVILTMAHIELHRDKRTWQGYLIVFCLTFIFIPQFGPAVLWESGAANYLWMMDFILAACLAFRRWDQGLSFPLVPSLVLSFLAGASSENGGGMAGLFALVFIIKWLVEKRRIKAKHLACLVLIGLGLLYQVLSPGNLNRMGINPLPPLAVRISLVVLRSFEALFIPLVLFVLALVITRLRGKDITSPPLIYIFSGLVAGLVMVFTPNLAGRSWLFSLIFTLIGLAIQAKDLISPKISLVLVILTLAYTGYLYHGAFTSIRTSYLDHQVTLDQIRDEKARGQYDVIVEKFALPDNDYNPLKETYHLREDPDYWFNLWFAYYYGLDSITISNPEEAR